jgi:nickel-type superoxide dismutase maturation protease
MAASRSAALDGRQRLLGTLTALGAATAATAAVAVGAALLGRRALRELDAVEVTGGSMAPTLQPGDKLLVESWSYRRRAPRVGEVVIAPDPRSKTRELVKRVAAVEGRQVTLRGDSAKSTDSRRFGSVPMGDVRARAALRYWPLWRAGPIPPAGVVLDAGDSDDAGEENVTD